MAKDADEACVPDENFREGDSLNHKISSTTLSFHMYFQYNRRSHQKMGRFVPLVQCQQLEQKVVIILHKVKSCFDIAEPKIIDQ